MQVYKYIKYIKYKIQFFFRGKKNNELDESQVTEEFSVTNTMELHQELEKEQNLEYYYNQEEEEEEDEKEAGGEGEQNPKQNKDTKDIQEEDKKEEKKEEEDKNNINNDNNIIINDNNNINIINENIIENNNNKINEGDVNDKMKDEEDIKEKKDMINNSTLSEQMSENSVNSKPQIIEEIDTTIPKKNNMEENAPKEGDIIIQSFSPNTICHRLIPKGSDLDISQKGYFQCYKMKTKSNLISFITGTKKIKVPYIIFIDENYYYMAKDKIVNPRKPSLRRIGNRYDLFKLSNFQAMRKDNDYEFAFEFVNEDIFDRTFKLLYFTPKEAIDFYTVLHAILGGFGITIPEQLEVEDEEEEEDEGEGEEYEEGEGDGEGEENEGEEEGEVQGQGEEEEEGVGGQGNIEDKKEYVIKKKKKDNGDNQDMKKENETKQGTISTKEESKDIRDVEIVA